MAADDALVRLFKAAHHIDQRGLAGAVRRQDAQRMTKLDPERGLVKDHLSLRSRPEGFGNIVKFKH